MIALELDGTRVIGSSEEVFVCSFPTGREPDPCRSFFCEKYRVLLTLRGCLDRQAARWSAALREYPRHPYCARRCEQGRDVAARLLTRVDLAAPGASR